MHNPRLYSYLSNEIEIKCYLKIKLIDSNCYCSLTNFRLVYFFSHTFFKSKDLHVNTNYNIKN